MDSSDLDPEQQNLIMVDAATIRQAEKLIESCEHYNSEGTEVLFDWVLDPITGSDSTHR